MAMNLTERDVRLVNDLALSHLLSRDQVLALGYFGSVTRANTRLRELGQIQVVKQLTTPFLGQCLYMAGKFASEIVHQRVRPLLESRTSSPRFVRHALAVTDVRIALVQKSGGEWRFEQQLWRTLTNGKEVRPDGLLISARGATFIEVDMGNVSLPNYTAKLETYDTLAAASECRNLYGIEQFRVLTVTTGAQRAKSLAACRPSHAFEHRVVLFSELGVKLVGPWS